MLHIYINQQFPPEVASIRRILQPVLKMAKNWPEIASLNLDKLIVDSIPYTVNNIQDIPLDISSLNQKENLSTVAFHGRFSPFINFFASKFTMGDLTFNCSEQHYQYQKALAAKDTQSAMDIMLTQDPLKMKRICDSLTPVKSKWHPINQMKTGLEAKFSQNK